MRDLNRECCGIELKVVKRREVIYMIVNIVVELGVVLDVVF